MRRLETIIWYPEAVAHYESKRSIVKRFCLLNGVSEDEFWKFIGLPKAHKCTSSERSSVDKAPAWPDASRDRGSAPAARDAIGWMGEFSERFSNLMTSMAENEKRLLDSRITMAKVGRVLGLGNRLDLSDPDFYIPSLRGQPRVSAARVGADMVDYQHGYQSSFAELCESLSRELRVCRRCISAGYHSVVHQLPWLERCVIHGEVLSSACPGCGRPYHDQVDGATQCPECTLTAWFGVGPQFLKAPFSKQELRPVRHYINWIASWEGNPRLNTIWWDVSCPARAQSEFYAEAVGRLGPQLDMPKSIRMCWRHPEDRSEYRRVFPMATPKAQALEAVVALAGSDVLVEIARGRAVPLTNPLHERSVLKSVIRKINRLHHLCGQTIARARNAAGAAEHGFEGYVRALCVHSRCVELLRKYWWVDRLLREDSIEYRLARLFPNHRVSFAKALLTTYGLLRQRGLGRISGRPSGTPDDADDTWTVDPAMRRVVNFIFAEQTASAIAYYRSHYSAIETEQSLIRRAELLQDLQTAESDLGHTPVLLFWAGADSLTVWGWRSTPRGALTDDGGIGHRKWVVDNGQTIYLTAVRIHEERRARVLAEFQRLRELRKRR